MKPFVDCSVAMSSHELHSVGVGCDQAWLSLILELYILLGNSFFFFFSDNERWANTEMPKMNEPEELSERVT